MPQDALLDPQGTTIEKNTAKLDIENITNIRVGKCISLNVEAENKLLAEESVKNICEKLLVNQITEKYTFEIQVN